MFIALLDIEHIRKSATGEALLKQLLVLPSLARAKKLATEAGFDLIRDTEAAIMAINPSEQLAVLRGEFDGDRVLDVLCKLEDAPFESRKQQGLRFATRGRFWVCVVSDLLVYGQERCVRDFADVLRGYKPAFANSIEAQAQRIRAARPGVAFAARADGIAELESTLGEQAKRALAGLEVLRMHLETAEGIDIGITARAATPHGIQGTQKIVEGFKHMLITHPGAQRLGLSRIIEDISVQSAGIELRVALSLDPARTEEFVRILIGIALRRGNSDSE